MSLAVQKESTQRWQDKSESTVKGNTRTVMRRIKAIGMLIECTGKVGGNLPRLVCASKSGFLSGCASSLLRPDGDSLVRTSHAGFYIAASGATYEGGFEDHKYHGLGTYKWPDGAEYVGQWSHGKMHGEGAYTGADGLQFVGSFYNGLYCEGKTHIAVR